MSAMQYWKDLDGTVHGFDVSDPQQMALMVAMNGTWTNISNSWPISPTLSHVKADQLALLQQECQSAITAGFTSSALGQVHNYGSQLADQSNLLSAVTSSLNQVDTWVAFLWCGVSGEWSLLPHTATRVQQVNADWLAFRSVLQQRYAKLVAQVRAATTVADILDITWG